MGIFYKVCKNMWFIFLAIKVVVLMMAICQTEAGCLLLTVFIKRIRLLNPKNTIAIRMNLGILISHIVVGAHTLFFIAHL